MESHSIGRSIEIGSHKLIITRFVSKEEVKQFIQDDN